MSTHIKRILVSIVFLFIFVGCEHRNIDDEIKIGISPWPGYEALVLGVEKELFTGVNVRIIRFSTPSESFKALRDGTIDVATFTADEVFHYAEVRDKPKIFLIMDVSNGGDAIVARPEIKSLDDLKGKRVASEASALGEYVINRAMDFTNKVSINDITLSPVEIGNQENAYLQNKADAFVTYEPSKTKLLNAGAHVIFDSKMIPNEIVDVMVTNNHDLHEKRKQLSMVVNGWFEILKYINENHDEAMSRMASYEGLSKEEFESAYSELLIPTLYDNKKMLGEGSGSLSKPLSRLSKLMYEKNSIKKEVNIDDILDVSLVKKVKQ